MSEPERGTEGAGRRAKRSFRRRRSTRSVVSQEVTIAEAAMFQHVDRSTIMRIRTVAKEGARGVGGVQAGCGGRGRDF